MLEVTSKDQIGQVTIVHVNSPFHLTDFSREEKFVDGMARLGDLVAEPTAKEYVVAVNGAVVERANWQDVPVVAGDHVALIPVPQGSDNAKYALRIVALIAVSYFTLGAGGVGSAGWITKLGFGEFVTHGIATAAFVGGGMLVNSVLPIPEGEKLNDNAFDSSPTYGIDGPKNTSQEGIPVPVVYGRHRVGGNLINAYVRNVDGNTQDLYMLFALSEGPIGGIYGDTILINDQPRDHYQDSEFTFSIGSNWQTAKKWFNDTITPVSRNITLNTDWQQYTTSTTIDKFRIDFVTSLGFYHINSKGKEESISRDLEIQYRPAGSSDPWKNLTVEAYIIGYTKEYVYTRDDKGNLLSSPQRYSSLQYGTLGAANSKEKNDIFVTVRVRTNYKDGWQDKKIKVGQVEDVPVKSTVPKIEGKSRSPMRVSFESAELTPDQYTIRVRRKTAESTTSNTVDRITWTDINEIQVDDIGYRHTALLGVKIRLSDQLSSMPSVSVEIDGRETKQLVIDDGETQPNWVTRWTNNPAWIAYDMLTNKRFSIGVSEGRIDIDKWADWASYCEANGLTFDGVFDTNMNLWEALSSVFRAGHAQIVNIGTRYSVAVDRPSDPVMLFSVANIVQKSFKVNWLPLADRSNEIEVSFFDKDDYYKRRTLRVTDSAFPGNMPKRVSQVTLHGIVDAERAVKEAKFQLNMNRLIYQTIEFDAYIDAIACMVGDVVLVQHDIPQWGYGGRTEAGSTKTIIKLDRPVKIESGKTYKLLVQFDKVLRSSSQVTSVVGGRYVYLQNGEPSGRVTRAIIDGVEYGVTDTFSNGAQGGLVLDSSVPSSVVGKTCAAWDTDVLEERTVTTSAVGEHETLTVSPGFSQALPIYTKWLFGEVSKAKKPFRITGIKASAEYTRTITAVEYNEAIYDLSGAVVERPVYSDLPLGIEHVTDLVVSQNTRLIGNVYQPVIELSWTAPQGAYAGADVFARPAGGTWRQVGSPRAQLTSFEYSDVDVDDEIEFAVVAVDSVGSRAPRSSAPTITHVVTPVGLAPGVPYDLTIWPRIDSLQLKWKNPTTPGIKGVEVWRGVVNNRSDAGTVLVATVMGESYNDRGIAKNTTYYYWLRIVTTDGRHGEWNATNGTQAPAPGLVTGLKLSSPFAGQSVTIEWDKMEDAYSYEVEVRTGSTLRRTAKVDGNSFTYTINDAKADGTPSRSINFRVYAVSITGQRAATYATLSATNPQVNVVPSNIVISNLYDQVFVSFDRLQVEDIGGYAIYMSTTNGFTPSNANLVYDGANNGAQIPVSNEQTYYLRIGAYDVWGKDGMVMSGQYAVNVTTTAQILAKLSNQISESQLAASLRESLTNTQFDIAQGASWDFDDGVQGWTGSNGAALSQANGALTVTSSSTNPRLISAAATQLGIEGSKYTQIKARIRRVAGTGWDGTVYFYTRSGLSPATARRHQISKPTNLDSGNWIVATWDMSELTGSEKTAWIDNVIDRLRLDLGNTTADVFEIDWIIVGRNAPGISQATAVEVESRLRKEGDEILGAEHTIKTQTRTSDGKQVIAGIGVAVENGQSGEISSEIILMADRVSIVPPDLGSPETPIAPFISDGDKVYLNKAVIKEGDIDNLLIGDVIQSKNYVPGVSGWKLDKNNVSEFSGIVKITGGSGYAALTDKPTSLSAISPTDASKLNVAPVQEQLGTIPSTGWYRIASNNGTRALAKFTLRDTESSRHNTAQFLLGCSYNHRQNATFALLGFANYGTQTFEKVRLLTKDTYDTMYVDVYVRNPAGTANGYRTVIEDNYQISGWTIQPWTPATIPEGYTATEWNVGPNETIAAQTLAAFQIASTAQETADGKIETFYQPNKPTNGELGDLWFDTDDGNKLYRHNGTDFVAVQDSRIAQAINDAATAQAIANGKIATYFGTTAPTNKSTGDLWYNDSTKLLQRWTGSAWQTISNAFTNTNQLTDGANLGKKAEWSQVTGSGKPQDNATVGASWGVNLTNIPTRFGDSNTPAVAGLYLTPDYMGYHNGNGNVSGWRSYIQKDGKFHFGGVGSNYIDWNGTTLIVRGDVQATSIVASATISAPTITGATITGSTVTGGTVQTSTSNAKRVLIDGATNEMYFYQAGALKARIGSQGIGSRNATGYFINSGNYSVGAYGEGASIGLYGVSGNLGAGVEGYVHSSHDLDSYGVRGWGPTGVMGYSSRSFGRGLHGRAEGDGGVGVEGFGVARDFYATGPGTNYASFTGAHDSLLKLSTPADPLPPIEEGDIVEIVRIAARGSLSNVIPEVKLCETALSKATYGALVITEPLPDNVDQGPVAMRNLSQAEYDVFKADYCWATVNAVGEGQLNVCDENGDFETGDFICTSSMPGKGMRYDGYDMRYVVAKILEPVNWDDVEPDEFGRKIKKVAVAYRTA